MSLTNETSVRAEFDKAFKSPLIDDYRNLATMYEAELWNFWQAAYAAGMARMRARAITSVCWLCSSDNAAKYPLGPSGNFHVSDELTDGCVECRAAKIRALPAAPGAEGASK